MEANSADQKQKPNFLVEVNNIEKQLWTLIHSKTILHTDVSELYAKAGSTYEQIFKSNLQHEELQEVEFCLWKLHYKHIDEFRKGLKTNDHAKHMKAFKLFLSKAAEFYQNLISKVRGYYHRLSEESGEQKSRFLCHRFYICLGDLQRYQEQYLKAHEHPNWSTAATYYLEAAKSWPDSGNPHNQLAVLATYVSDELLALYHCVRSLAVKEPFPGASNNLLLLFEKNRSSPLQSLSTDAEFNYLNPSEKKVSVKERDLSKAKGELVAGIDLWPLVVRTTSFFFLKSSFDEFGRAFASTIRELDAAFAADDRNLEAMLESYQFMDTARKGPYKILQIVAVFIYIFHNLAEANGSDIVKEEVKLTNLALTMVFIVMGRVVERCLKTTPLDSCPLLPALLVFLDYLPFLLDKVEEEEEECRFDEKSKSAISYFFGKLVDILNQLKVKDKNCPAKTLLALWEDHELKSLAPLAPIHALLDFSSNMDLRESFDRGKELRLQRIISSAIDITTRQKKGSQKWLFFDNQRTHFYTTSGELQSNGELFHGNGEGRNRKCVTIGPVEIIPLENERSVPVEEEEVILLKPLVRCQSAPIYSSGIAAKPLSSDCTTSGNQTTTSNDSLRRTLSLIGSESFSFTQGLKDTDPQHLHLEEGTVSGRPPSLSAWVVDKNKEKGRLGLSKPNGLGPIDETGPVSAFDSLSINSSTEHPASSYSPPTPSAPLLPEDASWFHNDASTNKAESFYDQTRYMELPGIMKPYTNPPFVGISSSEWLRRYRESRNLGPAYSYQAQGTNTLLYLKAKIIIGGTKAMTYMVYISFHKGEDRIRYSFLSHLSASLRRKGLISSSSFVHHSSNEIKIEKTKFKAFLVVISWKYVLSAECLDELAEIADQNVVVPVFYCITQSDVKHQCRLDILRDTFPLEDYSAERVSRWIYALNKTTKSYKLRRMDYGACELVEDIARDMYEKIFPTKRIGIYRKMLKLEKIVYKQLWGIRSIGIWGMPGIGKTTLAEAAFDQFSGDYEASCIIKDFDKEFLAKGLYHLWNEYLGENINNSFIKSGQKRLLIVLDNVLKPLDADAFLNGFDWFGPGSLIIITSRDKQVLVQCGVNQIYEVEGLNKDEAKQLLHGCAFGIDWRKQSGLETLAPYYISVKYFSGNPLALSLYEEMLSHMKSDKMEVKLLKLNHPPPQIMEVFKSNYNALNENEKSMFLDIACFFRGEKADYVMQLFEGCGFFPHVGIYVLVDKCLVTIVKRKMEMHNLIQIVGKAISNEGTVELDRHVRLWDTSIIQPLLEDEETKLKGESKGTTEDIEVIFLDMSNLKFFVKPDAFKSMHNLRFLKIYSSNPGKHQRIRFREALQSLPNELRLLHWEDYPLQSLPQHFDPTHLVELNMPYSKLQKLWGGTKNLEMLKMVRLSHSQDLVEIEELIKSKNIEVIDLQGCTKIQSFPATRHLQHLRVINLSGCVEIKSTQLEEFQGFPRNLKELYLSGTGIREVTSSIHLSSLEVLDLSNCKRLQNLPMGKGNLASLIKLMLSGCSKLQNIQDLPTNLKELYLAGTSIREVPSSICHLTQLVVFDAENCKKLQDLPMGMGNLISLTMLILSGCSELRSIPDLPRNLRHLNLAETPIKKLPSSFEDLTKLVSLDLNHCERLQHLQMESFESVVRVDLSGCLELKYILGFSLQDITQLHEDGTDKVMLHGTPPCNVTLILETWRTRHVTPMEKSGSKFYLKLMPFVTTPYRSKLQSSLVFRMYAMVSLFLSKAYLLDIHIPQEICNLLSLKTLDLSGNNFGKLPESIKQFRNLESLILCHCKNLESLPELPQSLEFLNAHGCVCLKNIHRSFQQFPRHCTFSNCFEISPDIVREILEARVAQMVIDHTLQKLIEAPAFSFSVPAFRDPNYIFHLNRGSSVMIRLTPSIETLLGFQISVAVAFWNDSYSNAGFGIRCVCSWKNKKGLSRRLERIFSCWNPKEVVQKSHMFIFYDVSMHPCVVDGNDFNILDDVVHFELLPVSRENKILDDCCTVTECGVYAITENVDQTNLDFRGPSFALLPPYKKRKRSFSGSEDIEMENQRLNISKTKQGDVPEKISQADTAYLTSPSLLQRRSHQVFLSFSEDVPRYFVSYLIKKLKWIGITVVYSGFMGGKSMSRPEVTQAIEESSISVVILSKDYVSSSKCLDELVEIIRWREENLGNRVMPIYYEMGTSDVMKQAKTIGNRLVETYLGKVVEKPELRWMRALAYIVNIVGESSQYWVDKAKMIEKTVVDVSNQMNILESNEAGLLFIYQEEENMENFKRNVYDEMNGVRIIPIWHVYAFLLIYLFLLILKSRFILRDVIHK